MSRGNDEVRVVLLTGAPVTQLYRMAPIHIERISHNLLCLLLRNYDYVSYIGHVSTANLISSICNVKIEANRGEWTYQPNDLPISVVLKRRPQGDEAVSLEDLEFYAILPLQPCGTHPSSVLEAWLEVGGLMPPCVAAP